MPQQELRMKLVAVFTEISFSAGLVSKNPAPMAFVLAMVTYAAAQWQQYVHFSRRQRGASLLSDSS
jgi:hypothetical protein